MFINDRMSKYSQELFKTSLFCENMAVFCGASGNKFLFSNENKYVISWLPPFFRKVLLPESLENFSPEDSIIIRRAVVEFLMPETLQYFIPIMDSMAKKHLETDWSPYKQVKALPLSMKYTFALACRLFMSITDPNHVTTFADPFALIVDGLTSVPINIPGTNFNRAIKAGKVIHQELLEVIQQRKKELLSENNATVARDFITHTLLALDENGRSVMNDLLISSNIVGLLLAGHDTTSSAITFVLKYLADFPLVYNEVLKEQMEVARSKGPNDLLNGDDIKKMKYSWNVAREAMRLIPPSSGTFREAITNGDDIKKMKYSWNVAREAMRLIPPSSGTFREAITDFTYAGFTIPKGWKAHWTPHSTHKNPKYFSNPEKFDPSRFESNGPAPYTFVPFGGGPRICPGREYARLEILVFMHNVVTRFKWEKAISDEKITCKLSPVPVDASSSESVKFFQQDLK
ncbi:beta-amyrin 28-monooxygenase [Quercus suber]|uniref:Beta-amyrin 28-monooxygenase n=1 Tax=Quercus suber TaxID=58331 RepID=A0AAW0KV46_QUESU